MDWQRLGAQSRNPFALIKGVVVILTAGLLLAWVILQVRGPVGKDSVSEVEWLMQVMQDPGEVLRAEYSQLAGAHHEAPRELARWLRRAAAALPSEALKEERWGAYELEPLLQVHAPTSELRALFAAYLVATREPDAESVKQALFILEKTAAEEPPPPLANQLLAQDCLRRKEVPTGVEALVREGRFFEEAGSARGESLYWAVQAQMTDRLRQLLALPGWAEEAEPAVLFQAGRLTGDRWLEWRSLFVLRLRHLQPLALILTFAAVGLWYVVLVRHQPASRWRWAWPLPALMAGVVSIWPTLSLAGFQEQVLGLSPDAPFPHNLWFYFGGIGLREELCKLALFVPFLPWLLMKRQPGLALITGAFVGLGFALEENLDYYQANGGEAVWTRFITANFMHAGLTGLAGNALYEVVRSRFHDVARFVTQLLMVIGLHGLYDFLILDDTMNWLGADLGSLIVLVILARQFFHELRQATRPDPRRIPPPAIFAIGSALLVALVLVLTAWSGGSWSEVMASARSCVALVPIGLLYWRELTA
ncbi:MAG: PrsW family intramembrane metalloprotease [Verrucomicrobiales bacterium]|nr:PrsW family intramembrane metalloprotease [Verrucomicrobiales bacterium]